MPRSRVLLFGILLALLAGFASACATAPQASLEQQQAFDAAIAVEVSDPAEAGRQLEAFLRTHPDSPLAEEAAARRAQLALATGDRAKAVFWLRWLVRSHPRGEHGDNSRLELARLAFQDGDTETVGWALEDVRGEKLSLSRRRLLYRLRADSAVDRVDRLWWLAKSRKAAIDGDVQPASLELLDAELARQVDELSPLELLRAADLLKGHVPAGGVALRLAALNMDAGDWDAAEAELEIAQELELGADDLELQRALGVRMEMHQAGHTELLPSFADVARERHPSTEGAIGTLAVLLPMTGAYASYGEESLRGVLLAAGIFDPVPALDSDSYTEADSYTETDPTRAAAYEADAAAGVRIVVYDTGGQPERAAEAIREIAQHEEIVAVVGPLRAKTSEAAAAAAEEARVPLLALTTREEIASQHPYVLRLRTTPEDELRYLVDYAFEQKGARRFAILHPEDNYGRGMRDHFWRMVVERGGWVVAISSYPPDATDFADPIRGMVGFSLLTSAEHFALSERDAFLRRSRRLPPEHSQLAHEIADGLIGPEDVMLPPIVDFDALFIPDGYENVGLIAPQLAFHEVEDVQLLGAGGWVHPELIEIAREHVKGAVISSLFDPSSRFPFVASLVEGYRAAFAAEPDVFAAQAYDAANLVLSQLARGRQSRDEVRDGLLRTHAWPGASGVTSLRPDGNARKRPFLLEVTRRGFVPLD